MLSSLKPEWIPGDTRHNCGNLNHNIQTCQLSYGQYTSSLFFLFICHEAGSVMYCPVTPNSGPATLLVWLLTSLVVCTFDLPNLNTHWYNLSISLQSSICQVRRQRYKTCKALSATLRGPIVLDCGIISKINGRQLLVSLYKSFVRVDPNTLISGSEIWHQPILSAAAYDII